MKKIISILCVTFLLVLSVAFAACKPGFTNPGDQLGGGGVGTLLTAEDTSAKEDAINDVVADSDLGSLSSGTDDADATVVAPTAESVSITQSGSYYFSGNYGGIYIGAQSLKLHFIFENAHIANDNGIAINGSDFKKTTLTITAVGNSTNTVENSGTDVNAVHIKGSLSINGKGSLSVASNSKSGIKVSKELKVVDVDLTVASKNHGISALAIVAQNCKINITEAAKDGLNAECDDSTTAYTTEEGYVILNGVNYTCNVKGDGIQADTFVYIDGGSCNITTVGAFVVNSAENRTLYNMQASDFRYISTGNGFQKVASDYRGSGSMYGLSQSCKGIKVGEISYTNESGSEVTVTEGDYSIVINSGTLTINSTDDGVHANSGDVYIRGGTLNIATSDDGITSDNLTKISGGVVNVTKSYEGIEGAYVEISGGTISVVSSDDGINAASDINSVVEHLIISGGEVTVNATGDGLDSNGSILISGGVVVVHGPTSGGDAGLDADSGILVNGGTLFVTASLGMVETPASNSEQNVVSFAQSTTIKANTNITVLGKNGNTVLAYTVQKNCQSIIFSSPDLVNGEYTIYGGDTKLATFTIQSRITLVGSASQSSNPGGRPGPGMPPGGRPPR